MPLEVSVPAILVLPVLPSTVNLLNPKPVAKSPRSFVFPVVDSTLNVTDSGIPPSVMIKD